MKNIIVITDSAKIADVEFKSLRQKLMDKELLVKSDAIHNRIFRLQNRDKEKRAYYVQN